MTTLMTRGQRIKNARQGTGLSAPQIADAIGISKQAYYQWEKDVVGFIKPDHMARFCEVTGASREWIVSGKGPKTLADIDETCLAILELCRQMNDESKAEVLAFARYKASV